ncbi:hypothetical protein MMC13_006112 [Lambiella insularis]|nr:hypothetical protein [Lambiella insularis]
MSTRPILIHNQSLFDTNFEKPNKITAHRDSIFMALNKKEAMVLHEDGRILDFSSPPRPSYAARPLRHKTDTGSSGVFCQCQPISAGHYQYDAKTPSLEVHPPLSRKYDGALDSETSGIPARDPENVLRGHKQEQHVADSDSDSENDDPSFDPGFVDPGPNPDPLGIAWQYGGSFHPSQAGNAGTPDEWHEQNNPQWRQPNGHPAGKGGSFETARNGGPAKDYEKRSEAREKPVTDYDSEDDEPRVPSVSSKRDPIDNAGKPSAARKAFKSDRPEQVAQDASPEPRSPPWPDRGVPDLSRPIYGYPKYHKTRRWPDVREQHRGTRQFVPRNQYIIPVPPVIVNLLKYFGAYLPYLVIAIQAFLMVDLGFLAKVFLILILFGWLTLKTQRVLFRVRWPWNSGRTAME